MPYSEETRSKVIAAVAAIGVVRPVALAWGINHSTVTRWCRAAKLKLPSARKRMLRGGIEGTRRAWGNPAERHAQARQMRTDGATLQQIRAKLGSRSIGPVAASLSKAYPPPGAARASTVKYTNTSTSPATNGRAGRVTLTWRPLVIAASTSP